MGKQFIEFLFHHRIHFDQRRPGTLEAFAGEFLGRVNAGSSLMVHG
jgi:hypothetical protein